MAKKFASRDKKVHKMTRDGLVEQNLSTGEEKRISQRGQDFNLQQGQQFTSHLPPKSERQSKIGRSQRQSQFQPQNQSINVTEPTLRTSHDIPLSKRIEQPTLSNKQRKMRKQQAKMFSQEATVTGHDSPKIQQYQEQQYKEHYNTNESRFVDNFEQSAFVMPETSQTATGKAVDVPPFVEIGQAERLKYIDTPTMPPSNVKSRQHGTKYQKNFIADATSSTKTQQNNPKLNFADQEKTPTQSHSSDKKLTQLQEKADKIRTKLGNARENLPTKKQKSKVRVFDEETGKVKHKLQIEKEVIPQGARKFNAPAPVAVTTGILSEVKHAGINKIRQKISQVEHENVGVEAAHKGERIAEDVYRHGKKVTRSAYQFVRSTPYRTVSRLEKQAIKANIKLSYQKAVVRRAKRN